MFFFKVDAGKTKIPRHTHTRTHNIQHNTTPTTHRKQGRHRVLGNNNNGLDGGYRLGAGTGGSVIQEQRTPTQGNQGTRMSTEAEEQFEPFHDVMMIRIRGGGGQTGSHYGRVMRASVPGTVGWMDGWMGGFLCSFFLDYAQLYEQEMSGCLVISRCCTVLSGWLS